MASQILVRASNPGYPGRWRAVRFFEHGKEVTMTVVEDPEGGPPLKASEPIDPETGLPDMARISRAGLADLKSDTECISVMEGDRAASAAALDTALEEAKRFSGEASEARAKHAAAEAEAMEVMAENDKLKARIAELEAGNLSLKDQAAALAAENDKLKSALAKKPAKGAKDGQPADGSPPAEPDAPPAK